MNTMGIQLNLKIIIPILLMFIACDSSEEYVNEPVFDTFSPVPTQSIDRLVSEIIVPILPVEKQFPTPTPSFQKDPSLSPLDITDRYPLIINPWGTPDFTLNSNKSLPKVTKVKPSVDLDLKNFFERVNNIEILTPGSEFLLPSKNCQKQEDEKFLVIDTKEYITRPILAKQISVSNFSDAEIKYLNTKYCWYIENQYIKDVNLKNFDNSIEKFYKELLPQIYTWFEIIENIEPIYIVITNLNSGISGYYSDSNNHPVELHYRSNEINVIFLDINEILIGEDSFLGTLSHELSHLFQNTLDSSEHSWVKEGTAEFVRHSLGFTNDLDSNIFTQPLSLTNLVNPTALQYSYLNSFFIYLVERFSIQSLKELFIAESKSTTGLSNYLKEKHNYNQSTYELFTDWGLETFNCIIGDCKLYTNTNNTTLVKELTKNDAQIINMPPMSLQYFEINNVNNGSITIESDYLNKTMNNRIWWSGSGDLINHNITFEFPLHNISNPKLSFDIFFNIEDKFDLVYLEISRDRGESWEIISTKNMTDQHSSFYSTGRHFTNKSNGWLKEEITLQNISELDKILVRFEYITDDSVNNKGFFIKNISITDTNSIIIDPKNIELSGFKNHIDLITPTCELHILEQTAESNLNMLKTITLDMVDNTNSPKYIFKKHQKIYLMLQCNNFEGEYYTSINIEYTV